MEMKNIKDFLLSIGLNKNETEVYSALSEMGASSVLNISKKTGLHRSNIYDALRSLLKRGLVFEIDQATKLFLARPPNSLANYLKQKEIELNEIIKEYETKYAKKEDESSVKISKGLFALREAINSLLNGGKEIMVFGIPDKAPEVIGPIINEFHKKRIKAKVLMKHIYNSTAIKRVKYLNKMPYTEARISVHKYDALATTNISSNKVIFVLWEDEISVIEINDKNIAQAYQNYYDILWKRAKVV
ncbi:hypothetical protein HYW74_00830 [Candidatus Pacearchaeota archaeon]|nr:hypothetical protein [Candidatus Pacearchaeota archaeon]